MSITLHCTYIPSGLIGQCVYAHNYIHITFSVFIDYSDYSLDNLESIITVSAT